MPSLLVMWSKWLPPIERARTIGIVLCATSCGVVFSYHMQKYSTINFRAGFVHFSYYYNYFLGCVGIFWAILWKFLVRNSPERDPRMTLEEQIYIRNSLAGQSTHKNVPIPWKSIFKSSSVLAIIAVTFVQNWTYSSLLNDIPNFSYLPLPNILIGIATFFSGFVIDFIQKSLKSSKIGNTRRKFVFVCLILQIIFVSLAYSFALNFQSNAALTMELIGLIFATFINVRIIVSYLEIAPQFAGVLYGLCKTVAGLLGIIRAITIEIIARQDVGYKGTLITMAVVSCKYPFLNF